MRLGPAGTVTAGGVDLDVGERSGRRRQAVLGRGRTIVGRADGAGVRCDDPALEPHHALLVLDGDGLRIVQLTGRAPLVVGGHPIDGRRRRSDQPTLVELGDSTLRLRHGTARRTTGRPRARRRPCCAPRGRSPAGRSHHSSRRRSRRRGGPPAGRPRAGAVRPGRCRRAGRRRPSVDVPRLRPARRRSSPSPAGAAQRVGVLRGARRRPRGSRDGGVDGAGHGARAGPRRVPPRTSSTTSSTVTTARAILERRDHRLWSRRAGRSGCVPRRRRGRRGGVAAAGRGRRPTGRSLHLARHRQAGPAVPAATALRDQPVLVDVGPGRRVAVSGQRTVDRGGRPVDRPPARGELRAGRRAPRGRHPVSRDGGRWLDRPAPRRLTGRATAAGHAGRCRRPARRAGPAGRAARS